MTRDRLRVNASAVLRIGLLVCAIGVAGCSRSPQSPTIGTISVGGLAGTWRLELLQPAGFGAELTPAGAPYTLTLDNGSASVRAGCSACTGTFTLVGDSLSIASGLTCTRAACLIEPFESQYVRILAGESTVGISGSTMTLVSSRGLLRFVR